MHGHTSQQATVALDAAVFDNDLGRFDWDATPAELASILVGVAVVAALIAAVAAALTRARLRWRRRFG